MLRRSFLSVLVAGLLVAPVAANAELLHPKKRATTRLKKIVKLRKPKRPTYQGRSEVQFSSAEKPGTIIIRTDERALYRILSSGKAMRYSVAVGKEGFAWSGVAKVGMKRENPTWTPPAEMIDRKPEYSKWAGGMPGGLPINPLGPRAMYLFNKGGDTGFRIHGTIHPESIGTAASSGCIRMLNKEVIELYSLTRVGTKVIVL
jgi:lipoprotein-anchoring transpeptidase ErfK/SrfK